MTKLPTVYYSNQVELLYRRLKNTLYCSSRPFTKRMIIVPSPAMKSWLMQQMAQDSELQVCLGLQIGYMDQSIQTLLNWLGIKNQSITPTENALALAIEVELRAVLNQFISMTDSEKKIWQYFFHYLAFKGDPLTIKQEKQLVSLSHSLAYQFSNYGKYGQPMINKWLDTSIAHWQQGLWIKLEERFHLWNYPARSLENICPIGLDPGDIQIHLFSLSFIPALQHKFFTKLSQEIAVHYYLVSPCQKFWTDTLSDKEGQRLKNYWKRKGASESQQLALEEYLRDTNPLLANFGRLGREMAFQVENSQMLCEEDYIVSSAIEKSASYQELLTTQILTTQKKQLTLLEAVQADLLLLRNPEFGEKITFDDYDETIQIHMAPSPLRETQILYQNIIKILDRHAKDAQPLQPSDIVVMAPRITDYIPFIHSVFNDQESQLDYQIMDLRLASQNPTIQAFQHLLDLATSRWDASTVIQLFEYSAFQRKQQFNHEEIQTFRSWVKKCGIRWGHTLSHRNDLLKRDHCTSGLVDATEQGTWEFGWTKLFKSLLWGDDKELDSPNIEVTQALLLGKIVSLMRSLYADLQCLIDGTCYTIEMWSEYLKSLFETYLQAEDEETEQQLFHIFDRLTQTSERLNTSTFTFPSIKKVLENIFNEKNITYRENHLNGVRFCSLMPMRTVPAKVIALLGLNDGVFPQPNDESSLNAMQDHKDCDYFPTRTDFDRYLFMEALLSARHYFLLSYQNGDAPDNKEGAPSLLIKELLSYLDQAYQLSEEKVSDLCSFKHPFFVFDQIYFNQDSHFSSYSQKHYRNACAFYGEVKSTPPAFTFSEPSHHGIPESAEILIHLDELSTFAKNPLKLYFNKTLGIYLEKEEVRQVKNEEDFLLSNLDHYIFSRYALKATPEETLDLIDQSALQGPFKKNEKIDLERSLQDLLAALHLAGIKREDQLEIEFCADTGSTVYHSGIGWKIPAPVFDFGASKVKLIGCLKPVFPLGFLSFIDEQPKDFAKEWPMLLAFSWAITSEALPITSQVLCVKKGLKIKQFECINPYESLKKTLSLYFQSMHAPCPFFPEWLPQLLTLNEGEFRKFVTNQPSYNDYLKWTLKGVKEPESSSIYANWRASAQQIFGENYAKWFPPKIKKETNETF